MSNQLLQLIYSFHLPFPDLLRRHNNLLRLPQRRKLILNSTLQKYLLHTIRILPRSHQRLLKRLHD